MILRHVFALGEEDIDRIATEEALDKHLQYQVVEDATSGSVPGGHTSQALRTIRGDGILQTNNGNRVQEAIMARRFVLPRVDGCGEQTGRRSRTETRLLCEQERNPIQILRFGVFFFLEMWISGVSSMKININDSLHQWLTSQ